MRVRNSIFPYSNTIVCIEDSKMLKEFQYDILLNTNNLQATLDELNKMNYFRTYENANTENYNQILDSLMFDTFELMREISPTDLIWRIFALYYDIHNMKLVVKERMTGKRLDSLVMAYGSYPMPTIRSAAVRESDNILENETLTAGFFEALNAKEMYNVDFILDRAYFRTLESLAEELGVQSIIGFVTERVDLYNISVLFQSIAAGMQKGYFTKAFSDRGSSPLSEWEAYIYNEQEDAEKFPLWQKYKQLWEAASSRRELFEELDVRIDNYMIERTKACKLIAFGIEPICAYFFNKLMEIKNIRILLKGKDSGYGTSEIRRRMRIPYEL